nr:hypothetical protein B456_011G064100 [Gossypium raimondii]
MAEGAGEEKKKFSIWDLPDVPMGQLPPHLELQRSRVSCNKDAPIHTESIQYSGAYASMGIDNSSRLDRFSNNFRVEVVRLNEDDMEFDMIVIDAAIANSFRRILIAEVFLIANKTSIIQDEVLAHRLGLVPIRVDPRLFDYLSENDQPNEKNTIVSKLHVQCKRGSPRITEQNQNTEAVTVEHDASSIIKSSRLVASMTTADALEELQSYKEMKNLLLSEGEGFFVKVIFEV